MPSLLVRQCWSLSKQIPDERSRCLSSLSVMADLPPVLYFQTVDPFREMPASCWGALRQNNPMTCGARTNDYYIAIISFATGKNIIIRNLMRKTINRVALKQM